MEKSKINLKNKCNPFTKESNFSNFSNPNLKFNQIINKNLYCGGYNDIFETFKSLKNNVVYLAIPNKNEYNLDIVIILDNKLFISLKGHKNFIILVKYFLNDTNNKDIKEYLISSDKDNNIIIWDIFNNFSNILNISSGKSKGCISGVILYFNSKDLLNTLNDYLIFSYNYRIFTKIFSLETKQIVKEIKNTNKYNTYYLLFWNNEIDNNNYIIELSNDEIYIINLVDDSIYFTCNLASFNTSNINCGFLYKKNNTNYLIVSSSLGFIYVFNLDNKYITFRFCLYKYFNSYKKYLSYILQWSDKYFIACEYNNKGFKIIDIDKMKIITSINCKHTGGIICAKKFLHPIYGESLLTSGQDNTIILWSI